MDILLLSTNMFIKPSDIAWFPLKTSPKTFFFAFPDITGLANMSLKSLLSDIVLTMERMSFSTASVCLFSTAKSKIALAYRTAALDSLIVLIQFDIAQHVIHQFQLLVTVG